jgi:hypothetical protein
LYHFTLVLSVEYLASKDFPMKKVLSLAAALCLSSMPVLAGGLGEATVDVVVAAPVAGNSFGTTEYVVAGVGVLLLAAALRSNSSSTTTTTTTTN